MTLVRIRDGELNEEQRKHREHQCLHYSNKHLKADERRRQKIRKEVAHHDNEHFTGKDVSEETE